jgi:CRISPR/Cas system CSM-associated protein Csm3 (group 7 of RAMP superfamily)
MPPRLKNPYDFVPLEEPPKRTSLHDRGQAAFTAGLLSGEMTCRLTIMTPLFIHHEGQQGTDRRRFARSGNEVFIPATSLKGMLRSVYEIVTNSCLSILPDPPRYSGLDLQNPDRLGEHKRCEDTDQLCPACALFGMVEKKQNEAEAQPRAGRLYLSDAKKLRAETAWVAFPRPRGGPRPSHRLFYVDSRTNKILGRKLYYHHYVYDETLKAARANVQTIQLECCVEGEFEFTVRFHNLTQDELKALVYTLELEDNLRHHLGFGKGYGLGTVQIVIDTLRLMAREAGGLKRYLNYQAQDAHWELKERAELNRWKENVAEAWAKRSKKGQASLERFRNIVRWPTDENYAYPCNEWFRYSPEGRSWTLNQYQGRAPTASAGPPAREVGVVINLREGKLRRSSDCSEIDFDPQSAPAGLEQAHIKAVRFTVTERDGRPYATNLQLHEAGAGGGHE